MANFAAVDELQFKMDDLNPIPQPKQPKQPKQWLKRGDGDRRREEMIQKKKFQDFTAGVGEALVSKGLKDDDQVTKLIQRIEEHNKNAKPQPTVTKKAPKKIIIPREFRYSDSDSDDELFDIAEYIIASDSDDKLFGGYKSFSDSDSDDELFDGYKSFRDLGGGSKLRKKSRRFRNNLRKNKISNKYIMLKQCGGGKAKVGAKSNPFSSKAKASRSRRKGSCYYKKKGRTLKMSKSSGKKKGTKKRRKKSRRRRR